VPLAILLPVAAPYVHALILRIKSSLARALVVTTSTFSQQSPL
jgi:hypothetical protein